MPGMQTGHQTASGRRSDGVPGIEEALASARKNRRDLAAQRLAAEGDRLNLEAAAGLGLPSLDLTTGLGWSGLKKTFDDSISQLNHLGFRSWNVGLTLSYVFGARSDKAEHHLLESAHALSQARTLATELAIEREVRDAVRRLALAGQRVRLRGRLERMQSEVLRLTQRKYRLGRVTSRERLDASTAALAARGARLKADSDYAVFRMAEKAAEGLLLKWLGLTSGAYRRGAAR